MNSLVVTASFLNAVSVYDLIMLTSGRANPLCVAIRKTLSDYTLNQIISY